MNYPTQAHDHSTRAANTGAITTDMAIDPVCGMKVDPKQSPHHHFYRDHDYHFCCAGCRTKFAADPGKYLRQVRRACSVRA